MKYYFSFRTDSITTCPPSDSATGLTGGPLPGLCGSVHHTDPLQDTSDVKLILDLRGTTRTPHVDHFKLTLPLCQHLPPPPWSRPAQLGAQGVELLNRPVPSRPVHPELHRLRTRPGRRHGDSRTPQNQDQNRVQDNTKTGSSSDRVRCDPIGTRI